MVRRQCRSWVPASWLSRRSRAIPSVSQSSQVQTIADYAKLSLSNAQPIMLALKKFIPCYAAALCIKTHTALLALCDAPHNPQSRFGIHDRTGVPLVFCRVDVG